MKLSRYNSLYSFDTCVFIGRFGDVAYAKVFDNLIIKGQISLSSIVIMELYAGTVSRAAKMDLDRLVNQLDHAGLVTTPDFNDYRNAGIILRSYSDRHGRVTTSPHFRDILIALGAAQSGAAVVTDNQRDFIRWQTEIRRNLGKNLAVLPATALLAS